MCLQWIVPATQKETAAGANADQSYQSWPWPWRHEIFPNVEKISGRGRGLCKVLQRDRLACAKCSKKGQQAGKHISAIKGPVSQGVSRADCAVVHIVLLCILHACPTFSQLLQK